MTTAVEQLELGTTEQGKPFTLPEDALVRSFAAFGVRGAGKTNCVKVLAEEFFRLGLPWIIYDPPGVHWGLRAGKNGSPDGGISAVVIGGKHGDLPIDKDRGAQIAEALLEDNYCAVLDFHGESKTTQRKFLTTFSLRLLETNPSVPRHIFLEEAADFCPQKAKFAITAQCKEAVERLVRQGRNYGYGVTMINQRPATLDKDVLSQAESLFIFRLIHKLDRKACVDWLETQFMEEGKDPKDAQKEAWKLVNLLPALPSGTCYFWSPNWRSEFTKVRLREGQTFHPGATRTDVRSGAARVQLADARTFIERMKGALTRKQVQVMKERAVEAGLRVVPAVVRNAASPTKCEDQGKNETVNAEDHDSLVHKAAELGEQLKATKLKLAKEEEERAKLASVSFAMVQRVKSLRDAFHPLWQALRLLFEDTAPETDAGFPVGEGKYAIWIEKAPKEGIRVMLRELIAKRKMTRPQLCTIAGVSRRTGYDYVQWLKRNQLVEQDGAWIVLRGM